MLFLVLGYVAIVALLVWMGYFMLGCLPLLILKHDTPVDARFIRGFFNIHYVVLMGIAIFGALAFGLSQRPAMAIVMVCVVAIGFVARRVIVSRMDHLRNTMGDTDAFAIRGFRQLHVTGIVLDVAQLVGFSVAVGQLAF